jgi:hypothetical protein
MFNILPAPYIPVPKKVPDFQFRLFQSVKAGIVEVDQSAGRCALPEPPPFLLNPFKK